MVQKMIFERHKYKFTDKHNSRGGLISFALGTISTVLLSWALYLSFKCHGNGGILMGSLGTGAFILSTIGLLFGLSSFKEEDKFYLFSWIGSILSGLLWIIICAVVVIGMY